MTYRCTPWSLFDLEDLNVIRLAGFEKNLLF